MKKFEKLIIFILGVIFGISVFILIGHKYLENLIPDYNLQIVKLNPDNLISSIRSSFKTAPSNNNSCEKYRKFSDLWNKLQNEYYDNDKLDYAKSIDKALKGFIAGINDPYTVYMTSTENESFQEDLKGTKDFEGIGAVVSKREDGVLIEELIKGSPSYQAGLKPLDLIIEINGEKTLNLTIAEAISKIRGPKGTEIELTIFRKSEKNILKIKVIRNKILVPSVMGKVLELTGNIKVLNIEISIIGEDTAKALNQIIQDKKTPDIKGIIVDLRGNGGGYLPIASEVASHFIPKDKIVVSTKYRVYESEVYKSNGYGDLEGLPIIILVDGMSASASEIIAAALHDEIGAKLLGTKTFGKGSIQTMHNFDDSSSLKYTIGKWFTPKNNNVDQIGITPDIVLEFDKDKYEKNKIDNQIEKAKDEIIKLIKVK